MAIATVSKQKKEVISTSALFRQLRTYDHDGIRPRDYVFAKSIFDTSRQDDPLMLKLVEMIDLVIPAGETQINPALLKKLSMEQRLGKKDIGYVIDGLSRQKVNGYKGYPKSMIPFRVRKLKDAIREKLNRGVALSQELERFYRAVEGVKNWNPLLTNEESAADTLKKIGLVGEDAVMIRDLREEARGIPAKIARLRIFADLVIAKSMGKPGFQDLEQSQLADFALTQISQWDFIDFVDEVSKITIGDRALSDGRNYKQVRAEFITLLGERYLATESRKERVITPESLFSIEGLEWMFSYSLIQAQEGFGGFVAQNGVLAAKVHGFDYQFKPESTHVRLPFSEEVRFVGGITEVNGCLLNVEGKTGSISIFATDNFSPLDGYIYNPISGLVHVKDRREVLSLQELTALIASEEQNETAPRVEPLA